MIAQDFLALRQSGEYDGPLAFGYGRVSHADQEDGDSVTAQGDRTHRYYELAVSSLGIPWGRFVGEEKHVSASKRPFAHRPAGKLLVQKYLRAGDHLIFDKIDRMWRSTEDFTVTRAWFQRLGIHPHVAHCMGASFEWESPAGKLFLTMMVGFAQFEADTTSDRIKRANRHKRESKAFNPGTVPMGCRRVSTPIKGRMGTKGHATVIHSLAWDEVQVALMDRVTQLIDVQGKTSQQVSDLFNEEAHLASGSTKPWKRSLFNGDSWNRKRVSRLYYRRKLLIELGYPEADPNTIEWRKLVRDDKPKSMVAKELLG